MDQNKKTILVVDDTPANIDVIKGVLSDKYILQAAVSGKMAFKIVEQKKPDLILLDIMMPEMDGYEVCKKLKENESTRDIPVIFLTAKTEIKDETKGFEHGAVDYITKPISPPVLIARVQTHLRIKEANDILKHQNELLGENAKLREDVEHITRHDLKTPLNSILAYPQIMRKDESITETQLKYINAIETAGRKLLNMINLSLDIYKMEQGTYETKMETIDIIQIFNSILEDTRMNLKSKGLKIDMLLNGESINNEDSFQIQGEELLLYSLFANLFKNAMEASPRKENIKIIFENKDENTVCIRNFGSVPSEIRDTFFDKYATSGKSSGTGLGTYSAKLITNTLNGQISLDTSIENETIIKLVFPE